MQWLSKEENSLITKFYFRYTFYVTIRLVSQFSQKVNKIIIVLLSTVVIIFGSVEE